MVVNSPNRVMAVRLQFKTRIDNSPNGNSGCGDLDIVLVWSPFRNYQIDRKSAVKRISMLLRRGAVFFTNLNYVHEAEENFFR